MYIYKIDEPIENMKLSNYAQNTLKNIGVKTIKELLLLQIKELNKLPRVGRRRIEEISNAVQFLNNESKCFICDSNGKKANLKMVSESEEIKVFTDKNGIEYIDFSINNLNLSVRAYNALISNGCKYASELLELSDEDIIRFKNVGKKTCDEIIIVKSSIKFDTVKGKNEKSIRCENEIAINNLCFQFINILKTIIYGIDVNSIFYDVKKLIRPIMEDHDIEDANLILYKYISWEELFKIESIRNSFKKQIIIILEKSTYGLSFENINKILPKEIKKNQCLEEFIDELLHEKVIHYLENGNLQKKFTTINEFLNTLKNERQRRFISKKLSGKSLQEIGDEEGLTREGVRRIINIVLKQKPKLKEDYYRIIFENYYITKEEFMYGFNENEITYNYLKLLYKQGEKKIIELVYDEGYPSYIRKSAEKIVYKEYIYIDGERVKKRRREVGNYILKNYCKDEVTLKEFQDIYSMFLEDYGLDKDDELVNNDVYFERRLPDSYLVLWKQWKKLRYYDILSNDYSELLEVLALDQYHDVEYSTKKFFNEFPTLMKQYDLRDEYELHNLLKKILKDTTYDNIKLKKMPSIEFGDAMRDNQILDLLMRYAPISNYELALIYEEEYGVKPETVLANYLKNFDEYLHNGIYSIDAKTLLYDELQVMRSILRNDFYTVNDIKRIYLREFPNGDSKLINPYTIKSIGFKVYSGYVISNKFTSAIEYFKSILVSEDITDLSKYPRTLLNTVTFTNILNRLKSNYSIVEFMPRQIITLNKLERVGIRIKDMKLYTKEVKKWVRDGEFFTISSLKSKGFEHYLDSWGFGNWFYSSILAQDEVNFSYRRIAKSRVFVRGRYNVSIKTLLEYVVASKEKIDIYDLIELIYVNYEIRLDKEKIIAILKDSYLYYDSIMEKIYIDYDVYFEEV